MLNRFAKSFCNLMVSGVALALTVPALAGLTPSPTASPTASPTLPPPSPTASPTLPPPSPTATPTFPPPSPTATPTATPTLAPTPTPTACEEEWPARTIYTIGKGQSAANNAKVVHQITGNIIDPDGLCPSSGPCNASRIPVCAGTGVTVAVTDSTGAPTNTNIGKGDISCVGAVCTVGAVNVTEKYKSVSADGKDTDRMTLLPK